MLKSTLTTFLLLLFYLPGTHAQTGDPYPKENPTPGFYGKRFTIQLGGGIHHNTLLIFASESERLWRKRSYYDKYKAQLSKDPFNYSLYGNLGIVLKDRLSLSVDFNYYFGDIFFRDIGIQMHNQVPPYTGYYYTSKYDVRVKYNTMRFMPRIEIATDGSNSPSGLVHILGVGLELSQLKSGKYKTITAYSYGHYMEKDSVKITEDFINLSKKTAFNLTLLYGLEYRLPVSRNIAWNFGAYAHVNLPVIFPTFIDESEYYFDHYEQERQLAKNRFQNLFSLRTGLVLML